MEAARVRAEAERAGIEAERVRAEALPKPVSAKDRLKERRRQMMRDAAGASEDSSSRTRPRPSAPAPAPAPAHAPAPPVAPVTQPAPVTQVEADAMVAASPTTISIRESTTYRGNYYVYDTRSPIRRWIRN
jgi:hypothetical protein